jgi:hypothetical protein
VCFRFFHSVSMWRFMNATAPTNQNTNRPFGFFRLSKAKESVDASPNTIRKWHAEDGLPLYQRKGERAVWVRFDEVEALLQKKQVAR